MDIKDRFLEYVHIDTQSDPHSNSSPTTSKQLILAKLLVEQLNQLNLQDIELDEYGIVYATLPPTDPSKDTIGFVAHMDTSPDAPGVNIKPQFIEKYDGGKILLNKEKDIYLDPAMFPDLKEVIGDDLITTDGTTLLGADDKAGISIIMDMLQKIKDSDIKHGKIMVAFTPDEEVGCGADNFDVEKFKVDYAYTIDGGAMHEIGFENFNAFGATVTIHGRSVHPGSAKNEMINAISVGMEFDRLLPEASRPEHTEGYEGFYHLHDIVGGCHQAKLEYIIRNHDLSLAKQQIKQMENIVTFLNNKYQYSICEMSYTEQYLNMYEVLKDNMKPVDKIFDAYRSLNLDGRPMPIRGGTDGARLTFMSIPCPNIATGGYNFHGPYEFVSLSAMQQIVNILLKIIT